MPLLFAMKIMLPIFCLTLLFAQNIYSDDTPFRIQAPEVDSSICVDTQPLNDGFGWNGTCGCVIGGFEGFANQYEVEGNTVAISTNQSPAGCNSSGSILTYHKSGNDWLFSDELVRSSRKPYDAFPGQIYVADDSIINLMYEPVEVPHETVPGATRTRHKMILTIFQTDNGTDWYEFQEIVTDGFIGRSPYTSFQDVLVEFDGETIFLYTYNEFHTYSRASRDEQWQRTAVIAGPEEGVFEMKKSGNKLALQLWMYPLRAYPELFWDYNYDIAVYNIEGNSLVEETRIPSRAKNFGFNGDLITTLHTSYVRESNGEWVERRPEDYWFGFGQISLDDADSSYPKPSPSGTKVVNYDLHTDSLIVATLNGNTWDLESIDDDPFDVASSYTATGQVRYDGHHAMLRRRIASDNPDDFPSALPSNAVGFNYNSEVWLYDIGQPQSTGRCDYSNAALYGGWGWNAITQTSCEPLEDVTGSCDYSKAEAYNGWGWNSILQQSCPPETSTSVCLDTVPVGDGWGWNGSSSCRVDGGATQTPTSSNCIDTEPVGDGWGWDGASSCRV